MVYVAAAYMSLWAVDGEEVDGNVESEGAALDCAVDEDSRPTRMASRTRMTRMG